ncbi:MAG: hypothetical protein LBS89_07115 [Zoogloeaceae bacterium]|nr:hypothetical protein [Zoogloeaceae bacterium]
MKLPAPLQQQDDLLYLATSVPDLATPERKHKKTTQVIDKNEKIPSHKTRIKLNRKIKMVLQILFCCIFNRRETKCCDSNMKEFVFRFPCGGIT